MEWPWQYNFPPFFTLQPNEDTKRKQFDAWCDLIVNYCKVNKVFEINAQEAHNIELFHNKKIDRKCTGELIMMILTELVKRNRAEWIQDEETRPARGSKNLTNQARKCIVLWYTLDEWAKFIYDYIDRKSLQNNVCTFYELTESKDVRNEKFYKIDLNLFRKCLNVLNKQRKAEVFQLDNNGEFGVKFF